MPHDYLEPLADLADLRPVVFYDQLGCGRSDRPSDSSLWNVDRFVTELVQLRTALGLDRVHLLGHSWGSMLALEHYLAKPIGIVSLTLASPSLSIPRWLEDVTRLRTLLPAGVQTILERHERDGSTDSAEYEAAVMVFYRRHLCRLDPWPECLDRAMAGSGSDVYETMWGPSELFMTGTLKNYDRADRLPEIDIPTLFTCGRYDEATPRTVSWYRSLVSKSELTVFEHSAHMAHLEEPNTYLQRLRAHLARADTCRSDSGPDPPVRFVVPRR
jgi:proline iminopeptidase